MPSENTSEKTEKEEEAKSPITIFKSTDLGSDEFLKLVVTDDNKRTWYYWSEKKTEEVLLGSKTVNGLECLYFFTKPSELFEIGGSECGFSLFKDDERLQWYDQIEPTCSMEMGY